MTNQIIGVLTRFHEEQIAFMVYVEAMYYKVQVPEYQQSFLKFLWWENHDIEKEPQDFVMCAHVFGGTSSASHSNYALRRTAVECGSIYGRAAAEALHHNFYVDDLLKSMRDLESAKQLVKNVISMCKSGGFHLTKFISNNKELLLSIPEHQRRLGMKNQDLCGDLPNEKALGICWNLKDDTFLFKLKVDTRTLTKRVMLSMISSIYNPLGFAAPIIL